MPCVTYTASRALFDDHEAGTDYSIDFDASELQPLTTVSRKEVVSIGGNVSSILKNIEDGWSVQTVPVLYSAQAQWDEFIKSVFNKEPFTFDPTGTAASPGSNVYDVYLDTDSVPYNRSGFGPNLMTISLKLVVIPE